MSLLTVVMYHYVREISRSRYPRIKGLELKLFVEQLEFFKENFNVVTMEKVIEVNNGKGKLPDNAMLLTFDDGYAEHFTNVYPVLKKFGFQGSFFVPVKAIKKHMLLDVNKIHFTLASITCTDDLVNDIKADITLYKKEFILKEFSDYFSQLAIENRFDTKEVIFIKRILQHALPEGLRNILTSKYFAKYVGIEEEVFAKELYMNENQLKQLVRDGMHVGCHGYDHYWWNKLDKRSLSIELNKSLEFLASLGCNMSQWTACYPYGGSSELVVHELEKMDCNLAFTTEVQVVDTRNASKYLYPRFDTNDFPPKSTNYLNPVRA